MPWYKRSGRHVTYLTGDCSLFSDRFHLISSLIVAYEHDRSVNLPEIAINQDRVPMFKSIRDSETWSIKGTSARLKRKEMMPNLPLSHSPYTYSSFASSIHHFVFTLLLSLYYLSCLSYRRIIRLSSRPRRQSQFMITVVLTKLTKPILPVSISHHDQASRHQWKISKMIRHKDKYKISLACWMPFDTRRDTKIGYAADGAKGWVKDAASLQDLNRIGVHPA